MSRDTQERNFEAVRVKEESEWDDCIGVSDAAARAGLYADHEVKDELVLGPVVLQPADTAFMNQDAKENSQTNFTTGHPSSESICIHRNHSEKTRSDTKIHQYRSIKEKFALKSCSVSLQQISEHEITMSNKQVSPLKKHLQVHMDKKVYSCDTRENNFTHEGSISAQTQAHAGKKHLCDICEKKFTNKFALMTHLRIHTGDRPFSCDFCGRQFTQKGDLNVHTRIHTGEKPHLCNTCGRRFVQKSDLTIHTRIHTGDKPYTCQSCRRHFRHKSSLTLHMRTHNKEKPYCCDTCGKYFMQRSTLIRHTRIHTDEKRHSCEKCARKFVQKSDLIAHKRTHTVIKYSCGTCRKQFKHKSRLMRHVRIHRGEVVLAANDKTSTQLHEAV